MLKCSECGAEFAFTAAEQAFYEERGFRFPPRRCKDCRRQRRDAGPGAGAGGDAPDGHAPRALGGHGGRDRGERPRRSPGGAPGPGGADRVTYPATCSACGAETTVPFKPDPARATFCRPCYAERRGGNERR